MRFLSIAITLLLSFNVAAHATVKLGNVQVKRSDSVVTVDLTFDKPVSAKTFHPTFERNFVQFVLGSTQIGKPKIIPVKESKVQKVFAYAYDPNTTRVRVILNEDNSWAKDRLKIVNANAKTIRVVVKDQKHSNVDDIASTVSAIGKTETKPGVPSAEEKKLVEEVLQKTKAIDIRDPESVKAALAEKKEVKVEKQEPAIGEKADPTRYFLRMIGALFACLALFVGVIFLVKKYGKNLKKLPFGKRERLIQVIATHHLGHKKSISMVKIAGEYMVVGISNEGISLIAKLGAELDVEKYLEDRFWGGTFEKHLKGFEKPDVQPEPQDLVVSQLRSYDGARDLGVKEQVLAPEVKVESGIRKSIREKLTKLKPLA
ncbi:MAG: flagellar biosynthetic protein FliO [Bacteriovoracia bacterium]